MIFKYPRGHFLTTQHERDAETGLDYRGARFYDADVARFLSLDPLAAAAPNWSPYRYCFDNPIIFFDPNGRFETRKEARQYRKEHDIEGVISKGEDGRFRLSNKHTGQYWQNGTQWEKENGFTNSEGVIEGTFVQREKSMSSQAAKSTNWYDPASRLNTILGASGALFGISSSSFRLTNGAANGSAFSPKLYSSGWTGGSRAAIKTFRVSQVGGVLGKVSIFGGILMDGIGVYNHYANGADSPNAVHPTKAVVNTGFAVLGLKVNPVAAAIYFGIDSFYPGGWLGNDQNPGALYDYGHTVSEYHRVTNRPFFCGNMK